MPTAWRGRLPFGSRRFRAAAACASCTFNTSTQQAVRDDGAPEDAPLARLDAAPPVLDADICEWSAGRGDGTDLRFAVGADELAYEIDT